MIYDFSCLNGHTREVYFKLAEHLGCETVICECGESMTKVFSPGKGCAYFEEARPRTYYNMGPKPVTVTSGKQYREALKKNSAEEAGAQITQYDNMRRKRVTLTAKGRWI